MNSATQFEENKYVVIPKAVDSLMVNFINDYIELNFGRFNVIVEHLPEHYSSHSHGEYSPEAAAGGESYSKYGDMLSDCLLSGLVKSVGLEIGLKLIPTYGYFRRYQRGNKLGKHTDRPSCEISISMCIGYEGESWPLFIEGVPIYQEPGDIVIYRGCELEHWRETFEGERHTQMLLHYNDSDGPYGKDNLYDGRLFLGLPLGANRGIK